MIDHVDTRALASATGFVSTASDLCEYASAHCFGDDRLLSDASKRRLQQVRWEVGPIDDSYGLGFRVAEVGTRTMVGHGGGYPGHITATLFDPIERLTVSVLTNAIDGPASELVLGIVKLLAHFDDGCLTEAPLQKSIASAKPTKVPMRSRKRNISV